MIEQTGENLRQEDFEYLDCFPAGHRTTNAGPTGTTFKEHKEISCQEKKEGRTLKG